MVVAGSDVLLLDHVFITVKDLDRSIAFYETALKPLGIVHALDYDGKDGPEGHPDLKRFGRDGRKTKHVTDPCRCSKRSMRNRRA